jgi:RHS repeat-associated protein
MLGAKYADAPVGMVTLEKSSWDDQGLAAQAGGETTTGSVYVEDAADPLVSGPYGSVAGTVTHVTSAQKLGTIRGSNLGAGADRWAVALSAADTGRNVAFTYEAGAAMALGTAPARRVALGYYSATVAALTADGWVLFDNAVGYARNETDYRHDANGNLVGDTTGRALTYNAQEQTTAVTVPGLSVQTYGYRGPGQTERATAASHPNGDTAYATGPLGVTATVDSSGRTGVVRDPAEAIVALRHPDGRRSYPLADALGSVVALTDAASGAVTNRYAYDPYGATTETRLAGAVDNPWRYTGAYQDLTGFYKICARYYQPDLGRWTQRDPVFGQQPYSYADDPINFTDPSGFCVIGLFGRCDNPVNDYLTDPKTYLGQAAGILFGGTVAATCGAFVIGFTGGIGTTGTIACAVIGRTAGQSVAYKVRSR